MRDCDASARGLISVETARDRSLALAQKGVSSELVSLPDLSGRILAEDIKAPVDLPPFDNSAMDGYALRIGDLQGNPPFRLQVMGSIRAGQDISSLPNLPENHCWRILTGAAVPADCDAVVMQEHVQRKGDHIALAALPAKGRNIRRAGEDIKTGKILLAKGCEFGSREIGALASIGLTSAKVFRKIRIALFCTGDELKQPGEALNPGQIYNSNRYMMLAELATPWALVTDLGAVRDHPNDIRQTLVNAAKTHDLIVTTGGVSVGDEDHVLTQLLAAGGQLEVMKAAMKPGKPVAIGRLFDALFVGLPGNPVAAFTTWKILGLPLAQKLAGQAETLMPRRYARLAQAFSRNAGRKEYRPARVIRNDDDALPVVELLDVSFSAKISLICTADGFAVLPAEATGFKQNARVEFIPLRAAS
jgi:molybdopterin molybdotransferase